MLKRSLSKKSKLKRSHGVVFTMAKSDSDSSTRFSSVAVVKTATGSRLLCFNSLFRFLLYIMPVCLFFSYYPVFSFGSSESMNFELSLALIWLILFDLVGLIALVCKKKLFDGLKHRWAWLLFPIWLTLSVVWSLNVMRGILTVGIMWLICFAGYVMWSMREMFDSVFRVRWLKWFFGATLVVCGWCVLQCVLDLVGISQDYSLMCDGCKYQMFGFPHPNGFAIEPQFMGNLLLAPAIVAVWLFVGGNYNSAFRGRGSSRPSLRGSDPSSLGRDLRKPLKTLLPVVPALKHDRHSLIANSLSCDRCKNETGSHFLCSNFLLFCFFIIIATLFLTFSRGAIYAFIVGMMFLTGFLVFRAKKGKERGKTAKRIGVAWGIVVVSFLFTLNLQGIMAEVSPTNDTYLTGVGKVLNHLSLGVVDIRGERESPNSDVSEADLTKNGNNGVKNEVVENPVENFENNRGESVFDGYVAESTDTRLRLTGAAMEVWSKDFKTMMLGVGIGGAGWALFNNDLSPAPKEIVQNEYASLLLETGIVGVSLLIVTIVLAIRAVWKTGASSLILSLLVAYGVSLLFFSGLPNALQIYLFPIVLHMVLRK